MKLTPSRVKTSSENLAKLLSVAYSPFCLCAPGSFCFIAFQNGLKTEKRQRKAHFKSLGGISSWEATATTLKS